MIGSLVSYARTGSSAGVLLHTVIEHHVRRDAVACEPHGLTVALSADGRTANLDPHAFLFEYETVMR